MSPLARPLLALAALLAVACADNCSNIVIIGKITNLHYTASPIPIPEGGGRMYIPDYCKSQNLGQLVGESVQACNNDVTGMAPQVIPTNPDDPTQPVDVVCPDKCPAGATAYVTQYCVP